MGVHANITKDKFPGQRSFRGKRTRVCFHYDMTVEFPGTIIRADAEEPGIIIIQLDNGRVVLDTECQFSIPT